MSIRTDRFFNNFKLDLIHTLHPLLNFFLEINSTCNLNCKHCYIPSQQKLFILSYDNILKTLKMIDKEWGKTVGISLTGGEPLMHPNFKDIVKVLEHYGFRWSLATNGLLLDERTIDNIIMKGCSTLTISLDGNEKTHDLQRNKDGSYAKTMKTIDKLIEKKFPNIYVTATIHSGNVSSLEHIYVLIENYKGKIKWRINPLLYCEKVRENNLIIDEDTYKTIFNFVTKVYKNLDENIIFGEKNPLSLKYGNYLYSKFDNCLAGITTLGVLANGNIVSCMVNRDRPITNVKECNSLKAVWNRLDKSKKGLCNRHYEATIPIH